VAVVVLVALELHIPVLAEARVVIGHLLAQVAVEALRKVRFK
jgi:hypothetical protein